VPPVTPDPAASADGLDARTDRPWRQLSALLVGLEGLTPLVLAVAYLLELVRGDAGVLRNALMLVALLVVLGGGLLAVAVALLRGRRGARAPSLTWQLLMLPISSYVWTGGRPAVAVAVVVVALLAAVASLKATAADF
jgi:hypothetical protein